MCDISIILPFYNNQTTLELAIKSVLVQTFKNWELLLINDGSTDSSLKIATTYAAFDTRIRLLGSNENKGLVFRLNEGISLSQGEYIARMDGDDIMFPERLEKQISLMHQNRKIDITSGDIVIINSLNVPVGKRSYFKKPQSLFNILRKKYISHPTVMAKKCWFINNKYREYSRAEDLELWLRSFKHTNHEKIPSFLIFYRESKYDYSSYKAASKTQKRILKEYKNQISTWEHYLLILELHLKLCLQSSLTSFKGNHKLISLRSSRIEPFEREKFSQIIKNIHCPE